MTQLLDPPTSRASGWGPSMMQPPCTWICPGSLTALEKKDAACLWRSLLVTVHHSGKLGFRRIAEPASGFYAASRADLEEPDGGW